MRLKINRKNLSPKQKLWLERNRLLWRLKGMYIAIPTNAVTDKEKSLLAQAFRNIRTVCDNSVNSSIELGFNAVPRCKYCGEPLDAKGKCKKCGYE